MDQLHAYHDAPFKMPSFNVILLNSIEKSQKNEIERMSV